MVALDIECCQGGTGTQFAQASTRHQLGGTLGTS